MLNKIFISYRREENKYQARMIFDEFQKTTAHVFYDVDTIPLGRDFREVIKDQIQKCDVLLALVGANWAKALDPKTGLRRLENPDDFVRIEIGTALNRGVPVVPVILDDAPIPEVDQLPADLRNLFDRQAEFISFRTFDTDVKRLIKRLTNVEDGQQLERSEITSTAQSGGLRSETASKQLAAKKRSKHLFAKNKKIKLIAIAAIVMAIATLGILGFLFFQFDDHHPAVTEQLRPGCRTVPVYTDKGPSQTVVCDK
jgi:hypothetical protein